MTCVLLTFSSRQAGIVSSFFHTLSTNFQIWQLLEFWLVSSRTTVVPWEFSFNRVNFVNPFQESDKFLSASTFPIVIDTLLLHDVQISVSRPCYIDVFQWNKECFFFRDTELNSKLNVMTIDEVTLNGPSVSSGFSVVSCFCRLKPFWFALKFSTEIFTSYRLFPPWSGFSEFVVSSKNIAVPSAAGTIKSSLLCGVNISFALSLRGWIPDASNFSNSSMSATRISPFQIPPAINAYPRNVPGKKFLPNW